MATAASMQTQRENYERIQAKTFTNWINMHLAKRQGMRLEEFGQGLRDGVLLINVLEVISEEKLGKYVAKPTMRIQQVENVGKALKFVEAHDVKLAGIGPEEIVDGNVKMTLGMIWTIILRFSITGLSEEGRSAKDGLLLWCQRKTEPYANVDVQDFSASFQDGLAFCALIHRHRPDLMPDYASLRSDDKLHNLNLAFDAAAAHLDIPRLLDAEDIVNMPRPDEKSVMTYVAQLYKVFSSYDKAETAGRRIGKFVGFAKSVDDMQHDYEQRARALVQRIADTAAHFSSEQLGHDYAQAKTHIAAFIQYKKTTKREYVSEAAELANLFGNIQSKLRSLGRPLYVPPAELSTLALDAELERLTAHERARRAALNTNLRQILEALRKAFADVAVPLAEKLASIKAALSQHTELKLDEQLVAFQQHQRALHELDALLPPVEEAERQCLEANIEENEYTDLTYDDVLFEQRQLAIALDKKLAFLNSQLQALQSNGVTAEQLLEFKQSFDQFDEDHSGLLSRLEFKSLLSGLGLVDIDFEGGDKEFEAIFHKVSEGGEKVAFEQFVAYMIAQTADQLSRAQLDQSFAVICHNHQYVTVHDMKLAQLSAESIEYLTATLPPYPGVDDAYDYSKWLASAFEQ